MASIVDIILRIKKQGEGIKDTEDSLLKLGKTVAIAAAAVTAFGVAANKAFDLAKQGAMVVQTAESFDLLLDKVGAAPNLLQQLDNAAGGTISQMEIMSSTATLLAGASGDLATQLANATPQLLEIARAANKLNPSLGDTTFLYQSIATGIKRASPLILDNLGLTIKVGEANEKYAAQLGKTVAQLTAEEQKQALLNETLRAGGVLIDQVGGNLDSATDSYTRFGAEAENATNRLKANLHEGLEPVVAGLANFLERTNAVDDALAAGFLTSAGPGLYRDAAGNLLDMGDALALIADNLAEIERLKGLQNLLNQLSETSSSDVWDEIINGMDGVEGASEDLGGTLEELTAPFQLLTDTMIFNAAAAGLNEDAQIELAIKMGLLDESTVLLSEHQQQLARDMDAGRLSAEGYALGLSSLKSMLEGLPESKRIEILLDIQGFEQLRNVQGILGSSTPLLDGQWTPGQVEGAGGAGGGKLQRVSLVGEKGQELIINGMVIPHDVTEWLLRSGMINVDQKLAHGGPLLDGVAGVGAVRSGAYSTNRSLRGFFEAVRVDAAQTGAGLPGSGNVGFAPGSVPVPRQGGGGSGSMQQTSSTQQQQQAVAEVATQAAVQAATQAAQSSQTSGQSGAVASVGVSLQTGISNIGASIERSNSTLVAEVRGLRDDIRRLERAQEDMIERVVDIA